MAPRNTNSKALTKKHIARLERERRQSRMIVWAAAAVVVIVFGLIGYSLLNEKVLQPRQAVATVGEEKITTSQFQARVRLQRNQIISQYAQYSQFSQMFGMDFSAQLQQLEYQLSESGTEALGKDVLDSMINEILLRNEAKNLDIAVSEEEIQNRIHEVFGYFPNGEPAATVTPTEVVLPTISAAQAAIVTITPTPTITATPTLELTPTETPVGFPTITMTPNLTTTATASLVPTVTPTVTATAAPTQTATPGPTSTPEPTATPLSEQGFEESFAGGMKSFSEMGVSEADYRKLIELDILRTQIFDIVTADVKPVQEQVWARHILAPNRVAAMTIRERLLRGEDFATLAAKFSLDTSNKDAGGDLGWFGKGQMVGPFEEAAFSQKVGEIGEPVQTDFGWHIIQVIGHEERPLTADLFDQAKTAAFDQWLSDLRAKAEKDGLIEIFDIWMERVPLDPDLASALGQQ